MAKLRGHLTHTNTRDDLDNLLFQPIKQKSEKTRKNV